MREYFSLLSLYHVLTITKKLIIIVTSIFASKAKTVNYSGNEVLTGIFKDKVEGPVQVHQLNIEGDQQADLSVHGGIHKAIYAYPQMYYDYWKEKTA